MRVSLGTSPRQMRVWQRVLASGRGESSAAHLIEQAKARLKELDGSERYHAAPVLETHLLEKLFPFLALYQVLVLDSGDKARALT